MIPGTARLAAEVLGLDARIGRPLGLGEGLVQEVSNPQFSTAVGLVLYGLQVGATGVSLFHDTAETSEKDGDDLVGRITRRMRGWFGEL